MNFLVLSTLCILVSIPIATGLNCVSCVGWSNAGCNDPYDEDTSGDIPVPGNTYCLKVVYPTYVERMAGGRACTPGSGPGNSMRYCCSDEDYCNGTSRSMVSVSSIVLLIVALLIMKLKFF